MAVESRFVVIRHGVEVQTFMDKKAADDYDKMLDMADNLTAMLDSTPFDLSDEIKEDLSIYLAQNREDVLIALQAKKAKPAPKSAAKPKTIIEPKKPVVEDVVADKENVDEVTVETSEEKVAPKKAVRKTKTKTAADIANSPVKETEAL